MANIIRSAKSGNDWTENELVAFNIRIDDLDAATFFNDADLPPPSVSPVILNNLKMPTGTFAKNDHQFFHYLRDAMGATGEEACVEDFAAFILRLLGYDDAECVIHQRKEIPFVMAGQRVDAKPDLCVMTYGDHIVLIVHIDKVSET
jgi:hypothetical protein